MILRRTLFAAALLLCAATADAQSTRRSARAEQASLQRSFDERYGLLEQRNIFLRDRSRPTTQRSTVVSSAASQPARRPEQMLFLTGIVLEEDGFRAYVEDTSSSPARIVRVSPGDKLGPGRVMEIQIDAIAYEQAGQEKWIFVGSDLAGQSISPTAVASGAGATTAPADGAAAANPDPDDPNLTVEQRMRLRSLQQRQGR